MREALFAMLNQALVWPQVHLLDLFAGSGALGIEALSRGAAQGCFVEPHAAALQALRANLAPFGPRAQLLAMPAAQALQRLAGRQFDLVLLDPPYAAQLLPGSLQALVQGRLLRPGALVVCEHPAQAAPPSPPAPLVQTKLRRFGGSSLTWFTYAPQAAAAAAEPTAQ